MMPIIMADFHHGHLIKRATKAKFGGPFLFLSNEIIIRFLGVKIQMKAPHHTCVASLEVQHWHRKRRSMRCRQYNILPW